MNIKTEDSIKISDYCWGYMLFSGVNVSGSPGILRQEFMELQSEIHKIYNTDSMAALPRFAATKAMFNALSAPNDNEEHKQWVAKILEWRSGNFVNSATDIAHHCAIKFSLPIGVYDADKLKGRITCKQTEGESYINRRGEESSATGIVLADEIGIFANPPVDAQTAMVTLKTKNIFLAVIPQVKVTTDDMSAMLNFIAGMLMGYNRGEIVERNILTTGN